MNDVEQLWQAYQAERTEQHAHNDGCMQYRSGFMCPTCITLYNVAADAHEAWMAAAEDDQAMVASDMRKMYGF